MKTSVAKKQLENAVVRVSYLNLSVIIATHKYPGSIILNNLKQFHPWCTIL